MHTCKNSSVCTFFESEGQKVPEYISRMKSAYCRGDNLSCARYMVKEKIFQGFFLPGDHALDMIGRYLTDLRPEDTAKARQLIGLMVK